MRNGGTTTNVIGSIGSTPYSRLAAKRVTPRAARTPTAIPIKAGRIPCLTIITRISRGRAPIASRMPSSRRRLRDGEADDPVNTDRGDRHADRRRNRGERPGQTRHQQGISELALHRPDIEDRHRWIGAADGFPYRPGVRRGRGPGLHDERDDPPDLGRVPGQNRQVNNRAGWLADRARLGGRDHPHDLQPFSIANEPPAQGRPAGKHRLRERFVDDRDLRSSLVEARRLTCQQWDAERLEVAGPDAVDIGAGPRAVRISRLSSDRNLELSMMTSAGRRSSGWRTPPRARCAPVEDLAAAAGPVDRDDGPGQVRMRAGAGCGCSRRCRCRGPSGGCAGRGRCTGAAACRWPPA